MQKQTAIELLGGTVTSAAKAIGVTYHAVHKWPDVLSPRVADRVQAASVRLRESKRRQKKALEQLQTTSPS